MWNPFAKQKNMQECHTLCGDRRKLEYDIELGKGIMEDEAHNEAYYHIPRWLVRLENDRLGHDLKEERYIQLLSERNAIPVPLGLIFGIDKEEDAKALTDLKPIAIEKYKETKTEVEQNASRNKFFMNMLTIAGFATASCILIFALISLFAAGKLKIPGIGG